MSHSNTFKCPPQISYVNVMLLMMNIHCFGTSFIIFCNRYNGQTLKREPSVSNFIAIFASIFKKNYDCFVVSFRVMSFFENTAFNSTLYEALYLQIKDTLSFAKDFFQSCVSSLPIDNLSKSLIILDDFTFYDDLAEVFFFNEFQFLLLKTFFLILLFTLLLIFVSWRVYGNRISERFMKPGKCCNLYCI